MTRKESYRRFVLRTARQPSLNHAVFGLVEEAGEVAGVMKRKFRGDHNAGHDLKARLIDELGDVRWYLELCCAELGVTLEEVENLNRKKLEARDANSV